MAIVLAYGAPAELIVVGIAGSRREHASADGEVVFVDASSHIKPLLAVEEFVLIWKVK